MTRGAFIGPSMMWIRPLVAGISQIKIVRLLTDLTDAGSCRNRPELILSCFQAFIGFLYFNYFDAGFIQVVRFSYTRGVHRHWTPAEPNKK